MKFRKKPVVVDAIRFVGITDPVEKGSAGVAALIAWVRAGGGAAEWHQPQGDAPEHVTIETLEGTMTANVGDWIIRGVAGEFYPCKPDIFAATYESDDVVAP